MQNTSPARHSLTAGFNAWALAPVALIAAALASPYFLTHGLPALAFVLHRGFALICHQQPERSFFLFGAPVAVCARCLGIYLGAALGLLLRTSHRVAMRLLVTAAGLNLVDILTEFYRLHGNWMFARFVLGLSLGAAAALLISSSAPEAPTTTAELS